MQCQQDAIQANKSTSSRSTPRQHKQQTIKPTQHRIAFFSHLKPNTPLLPCTPNSKTSADGVEVFSNNSYSKCTRPCWDERSGKFCSSSSSQWKLPG